MGLLDDFITQAHSTDAESIPSGPDNKITSRDFVSNETLHRLKINPYSEEELSHVPSFYTKVIDSKKGGSRSQDIITIGSTGARPSHAGADIFSLDSTTSEDSMTSNSTAGSVQLVPKHELKRQEHIPTDSDADKALRQRNVELLSMHALHDDTDVEDQPKQHVDYLSYKWQQEDDVLRCWRYVVLKKHDFADSARLENASWRTWAQTRNHIKTISPEELNWSKDSDVTWLYGPAFDEDGRPQLDSAGFQPGSHVYAPEYSQHQQRLASVWSPKITPDVPSDPAAPVATPAAPPSSGSPSPQPEHLKSILKKKSNVEKMISDSSYARLQTLLDKNEHKFNGSPILESTSSMSLGRSPSLNGTINTSGLVDTRIFSPEAPSPLSLSANHTREDLSDYSSGTESARVSTSTLLALQARPSDEGITTVRNSVDSRQSTLPKSSLKKHDSEANNTGRHIHFNMRVDQCIALDSDADADNEADVNFPEETSYNEYYSGDDDYSSSSSSSSSSLGVVIEPVTSHSLDGRGKSIAPLPSTTLKNYSDEETEDERSMRTQSHNTRTNRGYEYYYDYNRVYSNESNPVFQVVSKDVEMFDVPESCMDEMDVDTRTDSITPEMLPVQQPPTDGAIMDVPASLVMDVPDSLAVDIPGSFDVPDSLSGQVPLPSSVPAPAPAESHLKRTTSVGSSASIHNQGSINVGLSGLDLNSTGLAGSMGAGSHPQLYQLASHSGSLSSRRPSNSSSHTFNFGSDSDSESDNDNAHRPTVRQGGSFEWESDSESD